MWLGWKVICRRKKQNMNLTYIEVKFCSWNFSRFSTPDILILIYSSHFLRRSMLLYLILYMLPVKITARTFDFKIKKDIVNKLHKQMWLRKSKDQLYHCHSVFSCICICLYSRNQKFTDIIYRKDHLSIRSHLDKMKCMKLRDTVKYL